MCSKDFLTGEGHRELHGDVLEKHFRRDKTFASIEKDISDRNWERTWQPL